MFTNVIVSQYTLTKLFFSYKQKKVFPKLAKVNKMASKRFQERAESMRSDFGEFMLKQQGSFNKLANRWGLGDLLPGDDEEDGIHTYFVVYNGLFHYFSIRGVSKLTPD